MNRPTKTNPEYAAMAYRKALLRTCVVHLTKFTGAMGEDPSGKIISEDVIREDSEVPEEDIVDFITDMQQEADTLRLEMARYELVKREETNGESKQRTQRKTSSTQGRGKAKAKIKRRGNGQPARQAK